MSHKFALIFVGGGGVKKAADRADIFDRGLAQRIDRVTQEVVSHSAGAITLAYGNFRASSQKPLSYNYDSLLSSVLGTLEKPTEKRTGVYFRISFPVKPLL